MIRWMKTVVASVLIVSAVLFVVLILAQVFTGYDFSAAYDALKSIGSVELTITGIIEIYKKKQELKHGKDESYD